MADYASFIDLAQNMKASAIVLSGSTIALLLCALGESLENRGYWHGSDDFSRMTDGEWDEIAAIVGLAERELMKTGLTGTFSDCVVVPDGALLCDGSIYNRADYPDLYNHWLGTSLIIDADTFQVPNMLNMVRAGSSVSHPLLSTTGAETHTLMVSELPSHVHGVSENGVGVAVTPGELPIATPSFPALSGSAGSGLAHNNMQPTIYLKVIVWI